MIYFCVRNWDKYQHYTKRTPPWIKLYNHLLDDYEFAHLSDSSKLNLVLIWLLASRNQNKLPFDNNWIKNRIGVQGKVNLDELLSTGFIEKLPSENNSLDDASIVLADCKQDATLEREERERRAEQIPYDEFSKMYNLYYADNVNGRGHIAGLTDERKKRIKELWNYNIKHEDEKKRTNNLDYWKRYFTYCSQVPFLNGSKEGADFKADFDTLIKNKTYLKNLEGAYE